MLLEKRKRTGLETKGGKLQRRREVLQNAKAASRSLSSKPGTEEAESEQLYLV